MTQHSLGWHIAMIAKIGFKLQVTATPGFHSLYDWCYQTMWLFSSVPDNAEDDTVMQQHGADALYSAGKSLMHAIQSEDKQAQHGVAHRMIQIAKPWTIWRWWGLKVANGKPLVQIQKHNGHLIDLKWTEDEQAEVKAPLERYTSHGTSGACKVHRWRAASFSSVLGDRLDCNNVSTQQNEEWTHNTWLDLPIFRWLRETFLPLVPKGPGEFPEPDKDDQSREALLPKQDRPDDALPSATPTQKAVPFCPLPGQVRHLKWWLKKYFADHVDIFHMYADMGNDECTEMQLKLQDSHNPCVFVMTPKVGGTCLNLTAAHHAVITQMFWVLNKHRQAFAQVVRLGQNKVAHTWLLNMGPGGYDNYTSDLHPLSGEAEMKILHNLMSRPNIMTPSICRIL